MAWALSAIVVILVALAAASMGYRLLLGSPFEDPGTNRGSARAPFTKGGRRVWIPVIFVAAAVLPLLVLGPDSLVERWHQSARRSELNRAADSLPPGQALVIGDSIVAGSGLDRLCGMPVLNAGISGTGASEWAEYGPRLIASARPSLVVVAVGIVDARRNVDVADWIADYRRILAAAHDADIVLVSLHPIEPDKLGERPIRPEQLRRLNVALSRLSVEQHAALVPPPQSAEGLTTDGIHLNASGYRGWLRRLETACPPHRDEAVRRAGSITPPGSRWR